MSDPANDVRNLETGLQPGVLKLYENPVDIQIPDTLTAGEVTALRITTYGDGCISKGETRTSATDSSITVEPLDFVIEPGADEACVEVLRLIEHEAAITPSSPGSLQLIVKGREEPGSKPLTVRLVLTVR